jgi:hypothetical protein
MRTREKIAIAAATAILLASAIYWSLQIAGVIGTLRAV